MKIGILLIRIGFGLLVTDIVYILANLFLMADIINILVPLLVMLGIIFGIVGALIDAIDRKD